MPMRGWESWDGACLGWRKDGRWLEVNARLARMDADGGFANVYERNEAAMGEFPPLEGFDYRSRLHGKLREAEDGGGGGKSGRMTLMTKEQAAAKEAPPLPAVVEWVAENLLIKDVGPEDAPSGTAWSLLSWARKRRSEFFKSVWSKLLPSRQQIDRSGAMRDDGRSVVETCERLQSDSTAAQRDGAEGVGAEPDVQEEGPAPRGGERVGSA